MIDLNLNEVVFSKTVSNINLVEPGPFTVFDTDPTMKFFLLAVQVKVLGIDSISTGPVIQIRAAANGLTEPMAVGDVPEGAYRTFQPSASAIQVGGGDPVVVAVITPADAASFRADVTVVGYYRQIDT